jgi:hypothetical protein
MSCQFEKDLADVATDMVGGETPPEWLTPALKKLAYTVAMTGHTQENDPSCKEVRSRFLRVKAAASEMERALDGVGEGWLWSNSKDSYDLRAIRPALGKAVEISDAALKNIPSRGRKRARRVGGPSARVTCAIVVIEAWTALHGKPRGAHNDSIGAICEKYWRACGGDRTGKVGDPGNWRRPMKEAFADQSASRRYIHSELQRWTGQNPPENIGDSVP